MAAGNIEMLSHFLSKFLTLFLLVPDGLSSLVCYRVTRVFSVKSLKVSNYLLKCERPRRVAGLWPHSGAC